MKTNVLEKSTRPVGGHMYTEVTPDHLAAIDKGLN